ncbi:hypothetical protein C8R44DRAFT_794272 [Mycena epipterygia]|nr:hypothetical protein C8R44DRAFT_794272 [Mycena epipterygia]
MLLTLAIFLSPVSIVSLELLSMKKMLLKLKQNKYDYKCPVFPAPPNPCKTKISCFPVFCAKYLCICWRICCLPWNILDGGGQLLIGWRI